MLKTINRTGTGTIKPDFHLPTAIYIRMDILKSIASVIRLYGSRTVLITTASDFETFQRVIEKISDNLKEADIGCIIYDELPASPNTEDVDFAVSFLRSHYSFRRYRIDKRREGHCTAGE
jgi:alcohol dehydrogenase class IV